MAIQPTMKMKFFFFDRPLIMTAVEKANKKNAAKAGAFVRRAARSSIRRRKAVSQAGSPPSAHSRDKTATIKNILFGYDPMTETVIVGAVKLNLKRDNVRPDGTVPETLEKGGTVTVRRRGPGNKFTARRVRIAARPYMAPALKKEGPKFPEIWRDTVVP